MDRVPGGGGRSTQIRQILVSPYIYPTCPYPPPTVNWPHVEVAYTFRVISSGPGGSICLSLPQSLLIHATPGEQPHSTRFTVLRSPQVSPTRKRVVHTQHTLERKGRRAAAHSFPAPLAASDSRSDLTGTPPNGALPLQGFTPGGRRQGCAASAPHACSLREGRRRQRHFDRTTLEQVSRRRCRDDLHHPSPAPSPCESAAQRGEAPSPS